MAGFVAQKNTRAGNANLNTVDKVYPTTQITILDETGEEIGWIRELNPSQDRPVEPVRHLNAADQGRIVQHVPRPATYTLTATGFSIYKQAPDTEGSTIARLIANSGNPHKLMKSLEEQKIPFFIKEAVVNPLGGEDSVTVYHGCWITRWNRPMSIDNAFVTDSVDISYAYPDEV